MPVRRSSSSSRRQSSESEDRTSSTSITSMDGPARDKGKGKERVLTGHDERQMEEGSRSLRYPLSAPAHHNRNGASSSRTSTSQASSYPLSTNRQRLSLSYLSSTAAAAGIRRRRILHIVLALSIPVLGLLLANEIRISSHRTRLHALAPSTNRTYEWEAMDLDARPIDLAELRKGYEKKRRKEVTARAGGVLPLFPTPDVEVDEAGLREEVADHWPEWWGSRDVVGRSPFDHTPAPANGEKKRVLFLTSYTDYLNRMNTHTYEIVDAALRHPGIITDVWGPGWKGYNADLPLSVNVQRRAHRIGQLERSKAEYEAGIAHDRQVRTRQVERQARWAKWTLGMVQLSIQGVEERGPWVQPAWQEEYPDECGIVRWEVVWTISDIFKQHDKHLDALTCGALLAQQLGDCHEFRCFKEWYPQANNITLSKYAFELEEIFSYDRVKSAYPDWQMGIFGHNPDTGNEWDFYPVKWSAKVHDATMFGFDGSFYPIRTTITDRHHAHNRDKSIPEPLVKHHRHPGYNVATDQKLKDDPMETYEPGHWSYEKHRALREDFAKGMRDARICVFDSSLERKLIRKYAQAFLSGCVVAGDFPTEHEHQLSKFMIHIHPSWKIDRIEAELRKYLNDPARLEQMALQGFIYARRYLTSTRKIDHVLSMAQAYRKGIRGYEYPYSFSLRCRAYWNNDRAYRPPWCDPKSLRGLET